MIKRKNYAKIKECFELPQLVEVQLNSYDKFLQYEIAKTKRKNEGLEALFRETFPIQTTDGQYKLDYVNYVLGKPKYGIYECQKRDVSYASPLRIKLRLKTAKDVKEQEVYFGDLPLMTPTGTFIVNGDERVAVSQLHRSPGISFEETIHPSGKKLFSARIIPYRGVWIEFVFDTK